MDPTSFDLAAARVRDGSDPRAEAVALVAAMSLDEQLGCLDGDVPFWPGLIDMSAGGYYRHPWPAAVVDRLGVPGLHFADGPRGSVIADGTAFTVSMGRGATFDPDLEVEVGEAIGRELRAGGATFTGAVCLNLLRHPAWGRAQETYGEDPRHVGEMAAALTRGLQRHVMACMKHFALNSMENARFKVDVRVGERALHEVYLPHFRRVAGEGVASVMSAYNAVNGAWCGESVELLTTILRDEWGWDGAVISDFIFGLRDAAASVRAGMDVEMPFAQQRAMHLRAALEAGEVDAGQIRRSVERTVAMLLRFHELIERCPDPAVIGATPHRALARKVSAAATVLLRHHGALLPVDPGAVGRIAVLGRLADRPNLGDGGSSDVKSTTVVTPLAGLRARFGSEAVVHSPDDPSVVDDADLVVVVVGYTKDDEGEYIDNAGTAALIADLFPPTADPELGTGAAWTPIPPSPGAGPGIAENDPDPSGMSLGGDRASLRLRPDDEALIAAACDRHDRVVVVVQCGSAVVMPWADRPAAILVTWYPGVEGGHALADLLVGDAEPGGRLPFAIPYDDAHLVPFDRDADRADYGLLHGQWHLDATGTPAHFPFGSGLGYTDIEVGAAAAAGDDMVEVTVENRGDRAGSTVVFAHASVPDSAWERPPARLIGFARITASAGERVVAPVRLDWTQLDIRHDGSWLTEPGRYVVRVGRFAGDPSANEVVFDRGEDRR